MNKSNPKNNKFNCYGDIELTPCLIVQNVKYFLDTYKESKSERLLTEKFKKSSLYVKESQIPGSYELKEGFDRNKAFYIKNNKEKSKEAIKTNKCPEMQLKLSSSCELNKREEEENKCKKSEKEKENVNNNCDLMLKNLMSKIWFIKCIQENETIRYGPYSSQNIFYFLKNNYWPLKEQVRLKSNILINDFWSDVYYHPEIIYNMLKTEINNQKKEEAEKESGKSSKFDNY